MDPEKISKLIADAAENAYKVRADGIEVVYADAGKGDFATNLPFKLAGELKTSPSDIATKLAAAITDPSVERAEAAGVGFVNLTMTTEFWLAQLADVSKVQVANSTGKVQIEFISANPTGPLTLGNARGGFIGDVLARVLVHCGYDVTREYYFNDAGVQIVKLVESVKAAAGIAGPEEVQYSGEYINDLAKQFKTELSHNSDEELGELIAEAIFEKYLKPAIERMGIKFDVWFNEKDLTKSGANMKAIERLRKMDLVYDKDGAVWLAGTKIGDERDRVLIKSSGEPTYLANDIPYHLNIFEERKFDEAIKLFGADHAAQFPSLQMAIKQLVPEAELVALIFQFVRLMRDGQEVKMSKRAGTFVTVDELIDEIPADVARFFFLMRSPDSHMDFDLDLAKEASQKNPYWYVMYSYARANSILVKAGKVKPDADKLKSLEPAERELIKQMSQLPELVAEISRDYSVHKLTFYGMDVARLFHDFYEQVPIIKSNHIAGKLYLVEQYVEFMKVYFDLLGITPIDKM